MSLMKRDMPEPLPTPYLPFISVFVFSKLSHSLHIFLFFIKIKPPVSGQISDET